MRILGCNGGGGVAGEAPTIERVLARIRVDDSAAACNVSSCSNDSSLAPISPRSVPLPVEQQRACRLEICSVPFSGFGKTVLLRPPWKPSADLEPLYRAPDVNRYVREGACGAASSPHLVLRTPVATSFHVALGLCRRAQRVIAREHLDCHRMNARRMRQRFHLLGSPRRHGHRAVEEALVQESPSTCRVSHRRTVLRRGHAIELRGPAVHEARFEVSTFFGESGRAAPGNPFPATSDMPRLRARSGAP